MKPKPTKSEYADDAAAENAGASIGATAVAGNAALAPSPERVGNGLDAGLVAVLDALLGMSEFQ